MRIKDEGQSQFNVGEVVELTKISEENEKLKQDKKKPAAYEPFFLFVLDEENRELTENNMST